MHHAPCTLHPTRHTTLSHNISTARTAGKVRESRAKAIQESYEVMVMEKDRFLRNL
eukprot:CAMPEP_0182911404 /NCGR_PEP_ID=MMETSP0034_2-20130328/36901_1 /TAXON_ID=156128 /ORGANISM="Nephroselmis pyriformis, Strain CCMP717" /LENGTH=55 /DNA_ID=CAMNT_0025047913 /DNA_START=160 /DNA_END=323 /DNA_ORIENTATION=-